MNARSIHHRLMGALQRDNVLDRWEGQIRLPLPYTDEESGLEEDVFQLVVYDKAGQGPSPAQERAFAYLQQNKGAVCNAVRKGVFEYYQYLEPNMELASLKSADELTPLLFCGALSLQAASKDDCAFVYFSFECSFDEEHGIGVIVHKNTVINVGSDDVGGFEDIERILLSTDERT